MDYKEKYEKALERMKSWARGEHPECFTEAQKAAEFVFPELKKSEEEKIKNELVDFIYDKANTYELREKSNSWLAWLEKQGEPNPYSGLSFTYNGHTWGMCARDNGVEILIDGHIKGRVFTNDSNAKEMFIKALERVEEQNSKGYKLTDCDKNSWWEDFKTYTSCTIEQKPTAWNKEDERRINHIITFMSDKERIKDTETMFPIEEDVRWLKSLRPQKQWKPSKEQLYYLSWIANIKLGDSVVEQEVSKHLNKLYKQLKQL